MDETPEQKYNRIAAAVQQTILREFPNPDRVGCPGDENVREVAARRTIIEDDLWQHITHCSPCYEVFLAEKERIRQAKRKARRLPVAVASVVLIVLVGTAAYVLRSRAPEQIAQISAEPATLDLKESSGVRGNAKTLEKPIPVLHRRKLELTVVLPFGSEAGAYQFRLINADGQVLRSGDAIAALNSGATVMKTELDALDLSPGDYRFALRQQTLDWIIFPVRLQ